MISYNSNTINSCQTKELLSDLFWHLQSYTQSKSSCVSNRGKLNSITTRSRIDIIFFISYGKLCLMFCNYSFDILRVLFMNKVLMYKTIVTRSGSARIQHKLCLQVFHRRQWRIYMFGASRLLNFCRPL